MLTQKSDKDGVEEEKSQVSLISGNTTTPNALHAC